MRTIAEIRVDLHEVDSKLSALRKEEDILRGTQSQLETELKQAKELEAFTSYWLLYWTIRCQFE